jgi:hypothetical protein
MGKENQRPSASRFLFIITPLFPQCTPLSACVLCVLVGLYPLSPSATCMMYVSIAVVHSHHYRY